MNWLKGNGYSALVSKRCYSGNKIRCSGCCWLTSVNKKQAVNRLIRGFPPAAFYRQRRYGEAGQVTLKPMVSVLFMAPSLLLPHYPQSHSDVSKPIGVGGKTHTILHPTIDWTPPPCTTAEIICFFNFKSTWLNNFQQPQLSITTEGKHQNLLTVIVPWAEDDTPGNINDHAIPRHQTSFLVYGLLWQRLCSSIGVETDLWWLNLQVIKRQRVASMSTNSWLFTCWLPCRVSRDPFSLCSRHSMIPHDKLDCSSSESCWIILVLSIASPTPEIFLYCCLWAISLDSHRCRYSICSVTPKANEMC